MHAPHLAALTSTAPFLRIQGPPCHHKQQSNYRRSELPVTAGGVSKHGERACERTTDGCRHRQKQQPPLHLVVCAAYSFVARSRSTAPPRAGSARRRTGGVTSSLSCLGAIARWPPLTSFSPMRQRLRLRQRRLKRTASYLRGRRTGGGVRAAVTCPGVRPRPCMRVVPFAISMESCACSLQTSVRKRPPLAVAGVQDVMVLAEFGAAGEQLAPPALRYACPTRVSCACACTCEWVAVCASSVC